MSSILIDLTKKGWALSTLGALGNGAMARIHPLANALQTSPISIKAAIDHLMALGLVMDNPGHGHPLRPEFALTPSGENLAPHAQEILRQGARQNVSPLLRKRWALPIVNALDEARSFSQLRQSLRPVTDRALSLSLKDLTRASMVRRKVIGAHMPPRTLYVPTPQLAEIKKPLYMFA